MSDNAVRPSAALIAAMAELWRLKPPGPDNLLTTPAFIQLREACRNEYPNAGNNGPAFALSTALRSLGLPCMLPSGAAAKLALPVDEAVRSLDQGLRATQGRRIYLAPLDMAEELPEMTFGPAKVRRFSAKELRSLLDEPRLRRTFPSVEIDAERFSEFYWLTVEEHIPLDREPEARALPVLSMNLSDDLGRIEPHKGHFPAALEDALFFLLLAPWETWAEMLEVDWRGFRVPWLHTIEDDLFVRPHSIPSPDSLNWEERRFHDRYGRVVEILQPLGLRLSDDAKSELRFWDHSRFVTVELARRSPLFETPVAHFFVRAFLTDGMDEVLAHMTTIEAALGVSLDFNIGVRFAPDRHKGMGATKRMRCRVAGLLGNARFANEYEALFNLRSAYLHGRMMNSISTNDRVLARSLARQVVEALILAARDKLVISREAFLENLLDQGALLLKQ